MSPALSREERDAILARHDDRQHFEEGSFLRRMAAERSSDDVPALLDALDAAEDQIEQLQRQRAGALAELERLHRIKEAIFSSNGRILRENDALRTEKIAAKRRLGAAEAEVKALRRRIETAQALHHTVGKSRFCAGCYEGNREDTWPCATYTALDADEDKGTGR